MSLADDADVELSCDLCESTIDFNRIICSLKRNWEISLCRKFSGRESLRLVPSSPDASCCFLLANLGPQQ